MNKLFAKKLEEYLSHECQDYDLSYNWEWCEDTGTCDVEIFHDHEEKTAKTIHFKFTVDDQLQIELTEGCFYETRAYDETVKYFWMLVSPALFLES